MDLVQQIDELIKDLEDINETADMGNSIFALRQIRDRVSQYQQALYFFEGRFDFGQTDVVAHHYRDTVRRLLSGATWDAALDFEPE